MKSLLATSEAKAWVLKTAEDKFPISHKGNFAQKLVSRYSLPLDKSEKTGKYSLTQKKIEDVETTNATEEGVKQFLLTGNIEHSFH